MTISLLVGPPAAPLRIALRVLCRTTECCSGWPMFGPPSMNVVNDLPFELIK